MVDFLVSLSLMILFDFGRPWEEMQYTFTSCETPFNVGEPKNVVSNSGFLSRDAFTLPDIAIPPIAEYDSILDAIC